MARQITQGGARGRQPGSRPKKITHRSKSGRTVSNTETTARNLSRGPAGKAAAIGAAGVVAYRANKKYQAKRYEKASAQKKRALTFRKNRRSRTMKGAAITGTTTGIGAGLMAGAAGLALGRKGEKVQLARKSATLGLAYGTGYGGVVGAASAYSHSGRVRKKKGFEAAAGVPDRPTAPRRKHGVRI